MANTIQIKRGTTSFPSLASGEFAVRTDTGELVISDGTTNYEVLTETKFGSNTLVKADSADSPTSMTVAEDTIVGRKTGGSITALSGSEILSILSGTASSSFSANSQKITDVATPESTSDVANKQYVDSAVEGLDIKDSVRAASAGSSVDIATGGEVTVDGVSLSAGDRVLLKDQSTPTENGIYEVDTGAWSRAPDADEDAEVTAGMFVFVEEGTSNSDDGFVLTNDGSVTLGTTDLAFTQFSGAGDITAGTNLTKSGDTMNVGPQGADSGLNADLLDGTELANITWSDTAMATDDVSQTDVGLGNVENIALSSAVWSDMGISTTDVSASDVDLGNVENIALSNAGWSDIGISTSDVVDSSPTNGETSMAPSSDWAYSHENDNSAHGASGDVLGTDDVVDGGTF